MFLIKSIFLVIVNKKPPSKKVPLLLFQFPSPPTWNNWLSHLLNLYSFVINLYSSSSPLLSSNHFFVSKQKNGGQWPVYGRKRAVSVCFSWNRTVSAVSVPISARIRPSWPVSARISTNRAKLKKKMANWSVGGRVGESPVWVQQPWSHTHAF